MERLTMSLDESLAREYDELIATQGYASRSEALRDLIRVEIERARQRRDEKGLCVASLSYVYRSTSRDLPQRLSRLLHAEHDRVVASQQIHLDHDHCLVNLFLKGRIDEVRRLAHRLGAERGVQNVQLNAVSVLANDAHPRGPAYHHHHGHLHLVPRLRA